MPPAADAGALRTRDALALGLLHGPAELLPISSSAHVALVPWLLRWPYADLDPGLRKAFEVALHAGTVAALLVGMRREVAAELRLLDGRRLRLLTLSTLPAAVAGLAFERGIERRLSTPAATAGGLAAGALALAAADTCARGTRGLQDAGGLDGLALGIAQACALAPGVSRSGAALTAARARGFGRTDASVLARHVALPVIAGATALKALRLLRGGGLPPGTARGFTCGAGAAYASTLAALRLAGAGERDRSLLAFAAYRLALATLVLARLRMARKPRVGR
jgi:undecaprenyl-diphosphatase